MLLERRDALDRLAELLRQANAESGRVALIGGEAGIGKTSLLRAFAPDALWGACDPLFTPRPLGPLHDLAAGLGNGLADALARDAGRLEIFGQVLDALGREPRCLVIEDLHWADEATLDWLGWLGRRIERTRTLLIATYRDDEIGRSHPLRRLLGLLPGAARIGLPRLSADAVRRLAGERPIDEALELALASGQLIYVAQARAARAEAAWLAGEPQRCIEEARAAFEFALQSRHPWHVGELAFWQRVAGSAVDGPDWAAPPYALQQAGCWREAAAAWRELGCPYEAARALAEGDTEGQREALATFERLGARPAAEALRQRLHDAGVRGLPRGPRGSTREHPFGLTARELQVLLLLCDGLRNAEIAARLHRSVRTVDHHLAAVFAKLGVDSRVAAIQAAQRGGLSPTAGPLPAAR